MQSIQRWLRRAGGWQSLSQAGVFSASAGGQLELRLHCRGRSPTGLRALSIECREKPEHWGPELCLEIGDLAWYPYEYREPDLLFPFCVYRKEKGKLRVDHSLKRRLILMAEAWDQELLQYHLTA